MTAKDEYLTIDAEIRAAERAGDDELAGLLSDRLDGPWHRMTSEEQVECRLELSRRNAADMERAKP